ncbi:hypothetical protein O181_124940 [Austropuccinia psidii MF-1]|uniref:Uncharacterized protein n=1 Tax=Austropuccinia psidii MF-1 TaxID=1389203 RepID=A0A9Q3KNT4_9BASI|nr:hypothetical protein [Austropuccinia psidii MF-1]
MPVKHLPPARQIRSQAIAQAVLTLTQRSPLDGNQAVPQLRAQTIFEFPGEDGDKEEENSVEEEDSDGTEGVPAPMRECHDTGGPTLAQSNQPISDQSEQSLLAIMPTMTQIMANL